MSSFPLAAITAISASQAPGEISPTAPQKTPPSGSNFLAMISNGVEEVDQKLVKADDLVRAFALDDSVPLHQVTFALEEARLSLELMLQVRSRLVEGFQDVMRMQL